LLDASGPLRRAATAALAREDSAEDVQLRASAYLALVDTTESADDALELLGQTKQFFEKWGLDKAQLLLMELPLRAKLGDSDGFQTVIRTLTADYRNREDVMAGLQQLLVSMGLINPDGSPRNEGPRSAMVAEGGASPAAQSSGLWTPDGGSAAPAAASSQGAGKLWVPGMD
jgi:hypothetical protein